MKTDNPYERLAGGLLSKSAHAAREQARLRALTCQVLDFMKEHRAEQPLSLERILAAFPDEREESVKGILRTLRHTRRIRQVGIIPELYR
ncbi:hypothetical protein ACFYUL_23930 [Streptomyces sp. NPDC004311]|uniref:hypothetical protein n=1 Tax=Streptomyces sp. NPDC004311 TaxID=3364698 RepID=UPI0036885F5B